MKEFIGVRSNAYFAQNENEDGFKLEPGIELVIIHTNGKNYSYSKTGLQARIKLDEIRLIVSPNMLTQLITELQLHQKKLDAVRKTTEQINALANVVNDIDKKETTDGTV